VNYRAYIVSPQWQAIRAWAIRERGGRCECCDDTEHLEVHHVTYDNLGQEHLEDLRILCLPCHAMEHYTLDQIKCRDANEGKTNPNYDRQQRRRLARYNEHLDKGFARYHR
jgi:hypothetical protein